MPTHYLAEFNIGQLHAPIDDPMIAEFKNALDEINRLGEQSPGFIWRLKDDSGNATGIRAYDDPSVSINLTVWDSIDSLHQYTYYSHHTDFFRRAGEWFVKMKTPNFVLWWQPADQIPPSIGEAKARLDYLTAHGPSPYAFTFKKRFTLEEALVYEVAQPR